MCHPQRVVVKLFSEVLFVKINIGINDRSYVVISFNYSEPFPDLTPQCFLRHAIGLLNVEDWWKVPGIKVNSLNKVLCLHSAIFSGQKKMISSTDHSCIFRSLPVSLKLRINITNAFCCLNKSKSKFDLFHLHGLYLVPRYQLLILGNINAMN